MDFTTHRISDKNVDKRMGVVYNAFSKTVTYVQPSSQQGNQQQEEDYNDEILPPSYPQPTSFQDNQDFMVSQFANLHTTMATNQASILNQVNHNHALFSNQMDQVNRNMNNQFSYLYNHLHIPPYDPTNPSNPPPYSQPIQQYRPPKDNTDINQT